VTPQSAARLARVIVYGIFGAALTASSPLLSGILKGLAYAVLALLVAGGLIVVAFSQLVHSAIVGAT
jgi:hypothetical protein